MQVSFSNGKSKEYQYMLNKLLKDIFFDFQFWYDLNLWDENYESYSFIDNGDIISNVCVFKTFAEFSVYPKPNYAIKWQGLTERKREFLSALCSEVLKS